MKGEAKVARTKKETIYKKPSVLKTMKKHGKYGL